MPKRACTDAQKEKAPPPPPKRPGSVAPAAPVFTDAQQSPPSIETLADSEIEQDGEEQEEFENEEELFAAAAAEVERAASVAEVARAAVAAAETQFGDMADQMQVEPSNTVFFGKLNEMFAMSQTGFGAMSTQFEH